MFSVSTIHMLVFELCFAVVLRSKIAFSQLEVYVEHRLNKFLELLLKYMHDIVGKHSDADVLRNCAFTYRYFINNELSIQTTAAVAFRQLIDELVSSFHSLITDGTFLSKHI